MREAEMSLTAAAAGFVVFLPSMPVTCIYINPAGLGTIIGGGAFHPTDTEKQSKDF